MKNTYRLFNLGNLTKEDYVLVSKLFRLWAETFKPDIESNGGKFEPAAFWRSRILAGLFDSQNEPIALHIYNPYFIFEDCLTSVPYLTKLPESSLNYIQDRKVTSIMAMEYLCVHPDHRGRHDGFKVSELMIALGLQILRQSPWEMAIGYARADKKIDDAAKLGGANVKGETTLYNKDIKVLFCHKNEVKRNVNFALQRHVEELWKNKEVIGFEQSDVIPGGKYVKKAV